MKMRSISGDSERCDGQDIVSTETKEIESDDVSERENIN